MRRRRRTSPTTSKSRRAARCGLFCFAVCLCCAACFSVFELTAVLLVLCRSRPFCWFCAGALDIAR